MDTASVDIEMGNFSFVRGLHYARKDPKEAVGAAANSILARPTMWVSATGDIFLARKKP